MKQTKRKTKKSGSEKNFKFGEVMFMLENMSDGIQLISEQHGHMVNRLDGIDNRLDGIDNRLDGIDNRLDGIDNRLDKLDGRADNVENRLDRMQDDVTEIKHKLSEKVDRDEFKKMEKRVIKLEKAVFVKLA